MSKYQNIEQLSHAVEALEAEAFKDHAACENAKADLHKAKAEGKGQWDQPSDGGDKPPQKK